MFLYKNNYEPQSLILKYEDGQSFDVTDINNPIRLGYGSKSTRVVIEDTRKLIEIKAPVYTLIGDLKKYIYVNICSDGTIRIIKDKGKPMLLDKEFVLKDEITEMVLLSREDRNKHPWVIDKLNEMYNSLITNEF